MSTNNADHATRWLVEPRSIISQSRMIELGYLSGRFEAGVNTNVGYVQRLYEISRKNLKKMRCSRSLTTDKTFGFRVFRQCGINSSYVYRPRLSKP